ncbi:MAG: protein translocase subunit SecD [Myxococcales bacterium]|nr:protein translocase subunit SecD [Myxococcales bacterium]
MERSWTYRVVIYLMLTVLAAIGLTPSLAGWFGQEDSLPPWFKKHVTRKILLGLDLQGGLHIVYKVDVDKAVSNKADRLASEVEERLKKDRKVSSVTVGRSGNDEITVQFREPAEAKKLDLNMMKTFRRDLFEDSRDADKGFVVLKVDSDQIDEMREYAVRQGVETIRNRVDKLAVAEPTIIRKGSDIIVELPGLKPEDFERVKKLIGQTAQLEFRIVDDGNEYMKKLSGVALTKKDAYPGLDVAHDGWTQKDTQAQHSDVYLKAKDRKVIEKFVAELEGENKVPPDHEIAFEEVADRDDFGAETQDKFWRTYYLHRRAELTGEYISDSDWNVDQQSFKPEVSLTFDRKGADLFEKVSGDNVGRKMAIILDQKITSAPVLEGKIGGGRARITLGGGSPEGMKQEAIDLVAVLRTGALPAPLTWKSENQVGPTLGRDAVDKAKFSMAVGSLAVILFMLLYYRLSGLIANIAMVLNILFLLAILAYLPGSAATLTLPGIAGVVLTVGMAVDANIIIYERIREELRAGKSARGAVEAGFGRAFWTVFDAHVTNLVAGIVLFSYGTGPIRGFAVTLIAGIICNLFTSVWVSRVMFDYMVGRKKAATLSI